MQPNHGLLGQRRKCMGRVGKYVIYSMLRMKLKLYCTVINRPISYYSLFLVNCKGQNNTKVHHVTVLKLTQNEGSNLELHPVCFHMSNM